jgi:hypothetical protein
MTSSTSFAVPKVTWFFVAVAWVVFAHSILLTVVAAAPRAEEYEVELNLMSDFSRSLAAQSAVPSSPESPRVRRRRFPQTDSPHVCLAFLSCCDRIDLLNHTLAAAIRHMEEDEPHNLRYEIAWVDNGSEAQLTDEIMKNYQIEHALPMDQNLGLAFGMNLLIQNLCTAPYILLLEEDWLYLDDLVVEQTDRRKAAIATAIAFAETNQTAYDGRQVVGVFLRPETYGSFLQFPFLDIWQDVDVDLQQLGSQSGGVDCVAESSTENIQYQIVCSDPSTSSKYIWGSYTNGAGLYKRSALMDVGRMYGEPGDAFHERYVEGNFAYRAGLKYCHAAIQLGNCKDLGERKCTAAFYHIGGGRGTRPMKATNTKCASDLWNFVGTPMLYRYLKIGGSMTGMCSMAEIRKLKQLKAKEEDAEEYRQEVKERSKEVFEKEQAERQQMIAQARTIKETDKDWLRQNYEWMSTLTDEEIDMAADAMERLARSPHPLEGYWDSHGRPLK